MYSVMNTFNTTEVILHGDRWLLTYCSDHFQQCI